MKGLGSVGSAAAKVLPTWGNPPSTRRAMRPGDETMFARSISDCGGQGENVRGYDHPSRCGRGTSTLMGKRFRASGRIGGLDLADRKLYENPH